MTVTSSAPDHRRYLTLKEAAFELGVHTSFLQRRIGKEAGPPYHRRGRRLLFPRTKFLVWSEQKEIP